jgi:hypothetical protein
VLVPGVYAIASSSNIATYTSRGLSAAAAAQLPLYGLEGLHDADVIPIPPLLVASDGAAGSACCCKAACWVPGSLQQLLPRKPGAGCQDAMLG